MFVLRESRNFYYPQMHIVAPLDKKVENLKIFILVFYNFPSSYFGKKYIVMFHSLGAFQVLVKFLKGYKGW